MADNASEEVAEEVSDEVVDDANLDLTDIQGEQVSESVDAGAEAEDEAEDDQPGSDWDEDEDNVLNPDVQTMLAFLSKKSVLPGKDKVDVPRKVSMSSTNAELLLNIEQLFPTKQIVPTKQRNGKTFARLSA